MDKNEITRLLKENYDILTTEYSVSKIGIFGSVVKGNVREDSDLDIVVEFKKPLGFKFISFVEYLENLFGKKVDVITKAGIESIRVKEIAVDIKRNLIYV